MRAIAHCIDAVARNDPLRALDIMVQRLKALELSHVQGSRAQANQLELRGDGDIPAKADMSLAQGSSKRWPSRPWRNDGAAQGAGKDDQGAEGTKEGDKPPAEARDGRRGCPCEHPSLGYSIIRCTGGGPQSHGKSLRRLYAQRRLGICSTR